MVENNNINKLAEGAMYLLTGEAREALVKEVAESVVSALNEAKGFGIIPNHQTETAPDQWGSRLEAAELLKCSLPTIHVLMREGGLVFQKVGRSTVINLSDTRRKLEAGELGKYKRR